MASQMKFIVAFALIAALVCTVSAQDYDDEGGNQGNDGGFSGGSSDYDYAAPRDHRGVVGAEGSDAYPGYHHQGDESAGNDNYENDDSAAAASHARPTIAHPHLAKLIKQSSSRK